MGKDNKTKKKPNKKGERRTGPDAVAMKAKPKKVVNPFESITSRQKFEILGKKRKGEERRISVSRTLAVDKRKNTLEKEYERSLKASVFLDKRIGEQNDELGEFDKGIIRSQRERQLKLAKKSMYNLSDGEEDIYEDGALGGSSVRDDFDSGLLFDEDLEDDDLEASESKRMKHLNRNKQVDASGEEVRHKSKKEVMEEIIMKSKLGRMEKAKQKEEKEKLMDELDKNFESLVNSQAMESLTKPFDVEEEKGNPYVNILNVMAMEIRARPSERTKTPEEIAQKEREKLEALEEERKKRMQETDELSDEDEETGGEELTKRPMAISGDDLGDSFSVEEEKPKRGWIDDVLEREDDVDNSESDENDRSSEDSESEEEEEEEDDDDCELDGGDEKQRKVHHLKDWEQSDDELGDELEDEDEDDDEEVEPTVHKKSKNDDAAPYKGEGLSGTVKQKTNMMKLSSTQRDIPFMIDAPQNFEELLALVEDCSNADVILIVNRIRIAHSIKIKAENRKKMQVFYGILLQYFAVLASKKPLNYELLNMLVKPLIEMSMEIPYFAAICARQRLLKTRAQFCEAIKNPEDGCWPSLKTLFLLRLWSMIFPCSDFRHAVMTPSILLMCEYLLRCPISSGRDIAIGSFLCSIVLLVAKQSKKFCPEAILFIRTLLMAASDKKSPSSEESEFYHFMELKSLTPLLCIQDDVKEVMPLNFLKVMDEPADSPYFSSDDFRASILSSVCETLRGFVEINEGLSSFPEIFMPISTLLNQIGDQEKIPQTLKEKLEDVAKLIQTKTKEHHKERKPLSMRKYKPVAIKMVNPKFEENFVHGRDYDPDKYRSDLKKLKRKLKQEAKGAARELRKDNEFMSTVKAKEKAVHEQERAEKHGKNWAFLQEQEHAFKSGQLGKGRGKKRRR
ncbi:PREDICTED: nucleolar protein 14-like isoform X4 [Camelina sativa]|uniref:Nucleolar protein 14-like isoform X4 n=1 Tax=Camelina sativa TaxID=90675 RepID=A0ABM0SSK2_CAMSA|nr:PREDICTED: nucleolar protein 14-like isoform X4 [Camelina sativa]